MTDDELTAIEARANAATAGPWRQARFGVVRALVGRFADVQLASANLAPDDTLDERTRDTNAAFIASARTDVPKLVAEVRGQRETISLLTAALATASLERVDAECERDALRVTVLAACQRHPFNTSCDCTYCIGVRDGMARAQGEAGAALAELQRTVATAVECLRADGSAGNVERVCGWLDVVKGEGE